MTQGPPSTDGVEDNANLTPAARELLEEYVTQYRSNLILQAVRDGRGRESEIRLGDVKRAAASGRNSPLWRRYWAGLVVIVSVLAGALVSVSAEFLFGAIGGRTVSIAAILVGVASSLIVSVGVLTANLTVARAYDDFRGRTEEFLREVAELELLARSAAELVAGRRDESIVTVLEELERSRVFNELDSLNFSRIMKLRNSLVHERVRRLESTEQREANRRIQRLRDKLQIAAARPKSLARRSTLARVADEYEANVRAALKRVLPNAQVASLQEDQGIDFLIDLPEGSVGVVVKYTSRPMSRARLLDLGRRAAKSRSLRILLVSNSAPSLHLQDALRDSSDSDIVPVSWADESDDDALASAVQKLLADHLAR
ncbi:hypothetical protein EV383_1449 [Pseudonocardia sediminis]|uniref:Restriction endonuclease n=1 Tax=Pseudonocardia sediminis TaxID=1397368 RepID=A0A4Q7US67_PSEST|nr:hypothetical protein [Pseudonocardia sediminis]RZT84602.1 hypothetical protein EV383_1449 [Pseudonocardia sediminis]